MKFTKASVLIVASLLTATVASSCSQLQTPSATAASSESPASEEITPIDNPSPSVSEPETTPASPSSGTETQPPTQMAFESDQHFALTNGRPTTMMYFYASPSGVNDWEEDIFGDSVLPPSESVLITIDDGQEACNYDFRAIFEDGSDSQAYEVNLCELSAYTVN